MSLSRTQHPQSFYAAKSTVLAGAGVQDAYWSDDEEEDTECPLCMEEMDVAEMGFKPCPCGYQICMFCYHHIKNHLNGRCPACRREYLEENVEFTAVAKEDLLKQSQQKKRKERERKELEQLGRRHYANVRVVQRNVVYIVGLGPRLSKEEAIPTLRSTEYFGQYGKISKIILAKRNQPGSKTPVVGLYITYHRREDATRAINAVDGTPSPGGGGEVMRASYGTTKYCMSFLRGLSCSITGCLDLHEWGDKNDCFTKEDLATLKHSLKDSENQTKAVVKKLELQESTRAAAWAGQKPPPASSSQTVRSTRPAGGSRSRNQLSTRSITTVDPQTRTTNRTTHERRPPAQTPAPTSTVPKVPAKPASRPSTPATTSVTTIRAASPTVPAVVRTRAMDPVPVRSTTPASSVTVESDVGSSNIDGEVPLSPTPMQSVPAAPPGLPPPPSSYQISTQAQALLDDVRARRDNLAQQTAPSPFPDFDRTLDSLGGGDFQWSMDPKLAAAVHTNTAPIYPNTFDPLATLKSPSEQRIRSFGGPPGLASKMAGYQGPFNPFGDSDEPSSQSASDLGDGSRQESRFGFARRRASPSATSSPSLSSIMSPVSTNGSQIPYPPMDGPWPFMRQPNGFNQQLFMGHQQQPSPQQEYAQRVVYPLQNTLPGFPNGQFRQQSPAFPPGLRFRPFDSQEPERPSVEQYRAEAAAADAASQASTSMELPASEVPASSQPPNANAFGPPPGLSPHVSTPSSIFSPVYSEHLQRQPTPIRTSLPPSHHSSSMASTPAHVRGFFGH